MTGGNRHISLSSNRTNILSGEKKNLKGCRDNGALRQRRVEVSHWRCCACCAIKGTEDNERVALMFLSGEKFPWNESSAQDDLGELSRDTRMSTDKGQCVPSAYHTDRLALE
jgi:hypothetical protein